MSVFGSPQDSNVPPAMNAGAAPDPRLQPTPDYGTLGPGSDLASSSQPGNSNSAADAQRPKPASTSRKLQFVAALFGAFAAFFAAHAGQAKPRNKIRGRFAANRAAAPQIKITDRDLDSRQPQEQAEILLERSIDRSSHQSSAGESNGPEIENQIEARVPAWRGKLTMDSQLGQLTTAALNSSDRSTQASAIEVQIAAYGLSKTSSTVETLIGRAGSQDHAQKIWALWALGLLGNRGVATDRVVEVLSAHLKTSGRNDDDSRRWAVEGLALVGTTPTIVPLLQAMHDDPSPVVRERAACSLAQGSTLSPEQRQAAVPKLIDYSDDPALDAQTHAWAFQALSEITHEHLPNDSTAWREWYRNSAANNP